MSNTLKINFKVVIPSESALKNIKYTKKRKEKKCCSKKFYCNNLFLFRGI